MDVVVLRAATDSRVVMRDYVHEIISTGKLEQNQTHGHMEETVAAQGAPPEYPANTRFTQSGATGLHRLQLILDRHVLRRAWQSPHRNQVG